MPPVPSMRRSLAAILATGLISACAATPPAEGPIEPAPLFSDQIATGEESSAGQTASVADGSSPLTALLPSRNGGQEVVEAMPKAERLLGLRPADIKQLLGPAAFVRWEGRAQLAQYKSSACVFDVYFYEPEPGRGYQARHLSARTSSGESYDLGACLQTLLRTGQRP